VSRIALAPPPVAVAAPADAETLTASAQQLTGSLTDHLIQNREWQREAWDFYHAMGEFWFGITWLASACSRVRLVAAKKQEGGGEPEALDPEKVQGTDRQVLDVLESLGGGVGGRSMLLESLAVQLSVPGEGYVVGEQRPTGVGTLGPATWSIKSTSEIRRRELGSAQQSSPRRGGASTGLGYPSLEPGAVTSIPPVAPRRPSPFEVQVEEQRWMPLADESLVCRVWNPDKQLSWRACSAALPALPILREIDLLNRRIISELVSRIVMNGFLTIPEEATFPVRPEFRDAADPFIAEIIDIASKAIKTPGSAAAAIPIPLRVPGAFIDKIQHIKLADPLDPKLFEARDRAIKRLAATLNVPQEVVLGIADVSHWTAWQIDESAVKMHISPLVEVMCHGLTVGFLRPVLEAAGVAPGDTDRYIVWYDASELTTKPDLTPAAEKAHAAGVISDEAYRREAGFSEDDAPDFDAEDGLRRQVLVALALQGNTQAIGILWPDLAEDLKPPTPPGYDPETGRPLAPEESPAQAATTDKQAPNGGRAEPPTNGRVPATAGAR
jgi:hypothetical protein